MVNAIRVYIEGGGDSADSRGRLRQGFRRFLDSVVRSARERGVRFDVIVCGRRGDAWDAFLTAMKSHPSALILLLVDSEGPVAGTVRNHLNQHDGWSGASVAEEQLHVMVQLMEAWFLADPEALATFYGAGFRANALPGNACVEAIAKDDVLRAIANAIRDTNKPRYHKIHHAAAILERLDVERVRRAAPHCERFFSFLETQLSEAT